MKCSWSPKDRHKYQRETKHFSIFGRDSGIKCFKQKIWPSKFNEFIKLNLTYIYVFTRRVWIHFGTTKELNNKFLGCMPY